MVVMVETLRRATGMLARLGPSGPAQEGWAAGTQRGQICHLSAPEAQPLCV